MANRKQDGVEYKAFDVELHSVDRGGYSDRPGFSDSKMPSQISTYTGLSRFEGDDKQSLMAGPRSPEPGYLSHDVFANGDLSLQSIRDRLQRLKSWKVGVMASAAMTTALFLVNTALAVWAKVVFEPQHGVGTAYEGSCSIVSLWSFWLHILINILSTLLFSASNYTMQCVAAPTRRECDRAHARGDWLDIGVPSFRNFTRINWRRRVIWLLLALSSTPVHLLYNSAVFKTLDDNYYTTVVINDQTFLNGSLSLPSKMPGAQSDLISAVHTEFVADRGSFVNMSTSLCIQTYSTYYLSGYGDLVLITSNDTYRNPKSWESRDYVSTSNSSAYYPFDWICDDSNALSYCRNPAQAKKLSTSEDWHVDGTGIDYCLANVQKPRCKLQFSMDILIAVIVCNLVKCAAMLWAVFQSRDAPFITFGDAVASWLNKADESTKDRCFESSRSVKRESKTERTQSPAPRPIEMGTRRWRSGVSNRRWIASLSILAVFLAASVAFLILTTEQMHTYTADTIVSLGFGSMNPNMLRGLPNAKSGHLAAAVLFANLPQVIFSVVYLSCNALVTCMLLAAEYSGYEVERKTLRVTSPQGKQRSTYWLQVPYTFGIPIVALSAVLHWLISQSIFLVRVESYYRGALAGYSISAVGTSPLPMLVIVVLAATVTVTMAGLGFRKLAGSAMPIAASCSFALAAAAHRPADDADAATLPVKWGEVIDLSGTEVGHCCFTSLEVVDVVPGKKYAGFARRVKVD